MHQAQRFNNGDVKNDKKQYPPKELINIIIINNKLSPCITIYERMKKTNLFCSRSRRFFIPYSVSVQVVTEPHLDSDLASRRTSIVHTKYEVNFLKLSLKLEVATV